MVGVYGREEAEAWGGMKSQSVLDIRIFSDGWNSLKQTLKYSCCIQTW